MFPHPRREASEKEREEEGEAVTAADRLRAAVEAVFPGDEKAAAIVDAMRPVVEDLERERDALRAFARDMFECSDWPDGGDIDGFAFQDAAEARGLLVGVTVDEPCSDECWCAEYGGFPQTCLRRTELLKGAAIDAARRGERDGE